MKSLIFSFLLLATITGCSTHEDANFEIEDKVKMLSDKYGIGVESVNEFKNPENEGLS